MTNQKVKPVNIRRQTVEINLVPDVKRELIKAQILRAQVVAVSIVATIGAGIVVAVMATTVFGVQKLLIANADTQINQEFDKYKNYNGVNQIITIQNQLSQIDLTHSNKPISSRIFNLLLSITQTTDNAVRISQIQFDNTDKSITLEGQSVDGFSGLEKLTKSIEMTLLEYVDDSGQAISESIAKSAVYNLESARYGESSSGEKVLMFKIGFNAIDDFFANIGKEVILRGPGRTDVTDSAIAIPIDIFAPAAVDQSQAGGQQ